MLLNKLTIMWYRINRKMWLTTFSYYKCVNSYLFTERIESIDIPPNMAKTKEVINIAPKPKSDITQAAIIGAKA